MYKPAKICNCTVTVDVPLHRAIRLHWDVLGRLALMNHPFRVSIIYVCVGSGAKIFQQKKTPPISSIRLPFHNRWKVVPKYQKSFYFVRFSGLWTEGTKNDRSTTRNLKWYEIVLCFRYRWKFTVRRTIEIKRIQKLPSVRTTHF